MKKLTLILLQIGASAGIIAMFILLFGDNNQFTDWVAIVLGIVFLLVLNIAPHIKNRKKKVENEE